MSMKTNFPKKGQSWEAINNYFEQIHALDPDDELGQMSCYCMEGSEETQRVLRDSYFQFFHHNGVLRRMLPGVMQMEQDLLSMCTSIINGGVESVVANITSGGSESVFCAVHAIREWAREKRGTNAPLEIVAPYSVHPTFSKACHYLGLRLVRTPLGMDSRGDIEAIEAAITRDTIALVGSAPSWPHGLYDPFEKLSDLAVERGLWLHVDACVGGYLAPFASKAGYDIPTWDFRLPGVMSMSADLHKYGYAAKPASTVAWRTPDLFKYHHYSPSDWPGATYAVEAVQGSRPIGPVAAAYAILNYLGEEGYVRMAKLAMQNKQRLLDGIAKIPGLKPWHSDLTLTYYQSEDPELKVEQIVGGLNELGWPSFGTRRPPLVQLAVSPFPEDGSLIDRYLADVASIVEQIRRGADVKVGALSYTDES